MARIERGESNPRAGTRAKLCTALECTPGELALLLADETPEMPAGASYRAPTVGLDMLSMLEQSCRQIRTIETMVCPGLLQTETYATAIENMAPDSPSPNEITRRVGERMLRQQRAFEKDDPLRLLALVDPSILRSDVGGPKTMAGQVDHMRAMCERPNVTIRVLSDAARIAVASGPFKLLAGDDLEPFMVVTDDVSAGLSYRDGPTVVSAHHDRWRLLWRLSDALA